MSSFSVEFFDLPLIDSETGNPLQARYYTVDGIRDENGLRPLSIGQLVMAICFQLAVDDEAEIVKIMNGMAETVQKLEVLTGIQEVIINNPNSSNGALVLTDHNYNLSNWPGGSGVVNETRASWAETYSFLVNKAGCTGIFQQSSSAEEVVAAISSALDNFNTVNQKETIRLESYTNKRDQRYDLISNVLKSFNNVLVSIANNI